jgi:adenine-specific DNA-methyltransferase
MCYHSSKDYDWRKTDIVINDDTCKDIFDTFDLFNFTVREDEPLEKEVAVV